MKKYQKLGLSVIIALILFNITPHFARALTEQEIKDKVIQLNGEHGMCSGSQVQGDSGHSYILTAAHCRSLADKDDTLMATTEDGRQIRRKVIAEDPNSDLLLLEGIPGMKGLKMSGAENNKRDEHLRTFTHGNKLKTYKTEGKTIDVVDIRIPLRDITDEADAKACESQAKYKAVKINVFIFQVWYCVLQVKEIITDAKIVPGSSGGAIVNDNGDLLGVASAASADFGYFVPLKDIHVFLHNY